MPPQLPRHCPPVSQRQSCRNESPDCMTLFPNCASPLIRIRKQDSLIIESFILKSGVCSFKRISQTLTVLRPQQYTRAPRRQRLVHQKQQPGHDMPHYTTKPTELSKTATRTTKQATSRLWLCEKKLLVKGPLF